jgi:hypothetical protein
MRNYLLLALVGVCVILVASLFVNTRSTNGGQPAQTLDVDSDENVAIRHAIEQFWVHSSNNDDRWEDFATGNPKNWNSACAPVASLAVSPESNKGNGLVTDTNKEKKASKRIKVDKGGLSLSSYNRKFVNRLVRDFAANIHTRRLSLEKIEIIRVKGPESVVAISYRLVTEYSQIVFREPLI